MQPGLLGAISPEEQRGLLEPYDRPPPSPFAGLLGPPLSDRMNDARLAKQARWDAGQRNPTPLTEENMWLADDVAGSFLGGIGAIKAFHGTPHRYRAERRIRMPDGSERFVEGGINQLPDVPFGAEVVRDYPLGRMRSDKIGTGEGNQAFGHGLYNAENEGVAREYRDSLAATVDVGDPATIARAQEQTRGGRREAAQYMRENIDAELRKPDPDMDWVKKYRPALEILEGDAPLPQSVGALYTTRLNVEPDDLLDWDLPLSQQSEKVRAFFQDQTAAKALKEAKSDGSPQWLIDFLENQQRNAASMDQNKTGAELYREISRGQEAQASAALREAGIPGIRYLDQGSRTAGEGTRNFVIFDDSLIDIEGLL